LPKVPLPELKRENIYPKTFDFVFIGYAQNSAAYRFISLNDFSICEFRDAVFFEQVFPSKKNVSTIVHEIVPVHNNANMRASSSVVRGLVNEPTRSKRRRIQTSFSLDFIIAFFIEDFDVNFLTNELVSAFFIEEDLKTFVEAMRSIDARFWKEIIKSELDSIMSN